MTQQIVWEENNESVTRNWISQSHLSPPKKVRIGDDTLTADVFYQSTSEGAGYIWRGDFQNAKQLLQAVERRIERNSQRKKNTEKKSAKDLFHQYRQAQAHRAQLLSRLLIEVNPDLSIELRRAPDMSLAIREALGASLNNKGFVISLRELLGFIGAHEWRKNGVMIDSLENKIHAHYGVFSPVRGEYLDLVLQAPLPAKTQNAFDIGTGTGVIAALLAKRGVQKITATDTNPVALACAQENIDRLGFSDQVTIINQDLFPHGLADLVVCNPPWVPARPTSAIEHAVYDENSKMLKAFLAGAAKHLTPTGEAWLIMSDIAEHLGLRETDDIKNWIQSGGLKVIDRLDISPRHSKARDENNVLHHARSKEITSLWRLTRT